ncbi:MULTISPECIES: exopolyphosphatase [Thalassolituus]|jgi:exopolyphosphatase/guanosine-5'-triphosphate,3'-diphosphate pyrophosphatase|uniref:exopolyphosphatase n=1 Tax=Thalassolituus TaxID=187492 RepID=UPI001CE3A3E8|nr:MULTISPECIES: exopolyphosphatase [Thalassolituus]MBU2040309.1 exopolyphosphatase [Gammaproteobacteria bacterium]MCA6058856.1 exopolyphosphatase [Thalassolituus sp. ST750PaO-4]MCB2385954.1 exopolyphosphatase [Thalassolituus alkanivorans]MCB2422581.1 exopolyphosphatase [Thalassolituus alkanivorans]
MTDNTGAMNDLIAAVDLGSNSFHMVIAQEFQGEIRTLERRGQKVQLAAGLDERGILSEEAQQRGLECLREFAQFMQGMEPRRVSVLATNALRAARNRQQFIERAEEILGYPIEVIAGREEARLIYLGVAHTLADDAGRRLVVDIGGGSTEFIIGERFEPKALESLHMGCVSYTKQFFPDGVITEARFDDAVDAARQELLNIETHYKQLGWHSAVGSSGTIRAAEQALVENGWEAEGITPAGLKKLRKQMLQYATTDDVSLPGVKPERRQVFIGGLAILQAVFDTFGLERMIYSDGALREGALWDLVGRSTHENVRERTVQAMAERFYVDTAQAQRVKEMARALFAQVQKDWKLDNGWGYWLDWASQLHEIGLSIAHSGFHKHGAYLVQHADLLGFTRQGQAKLAAMVRSHRRKFLPECFSEIAPASRTAMIQITRLLRLAVVLNHSRGAHPVPCPLLRSEGDRLQLVLPEGWLAEHPLTARDLAAEVSQQKGAGFSLEIA